MREIKFRAWYEKFNEMYIVKGIDFQREMVYFDIYNYRSIYDIELMQYSGLTDMMEKEIYEGDILFESSEEKYLKVVFEDGSFSLDSEEYSLPLKEYAHICKIVGNIYESPELLREIE